jgi:hypothetical protein
MVSMISEWFSWPSASCSVSLVGSCFGAIAAAGGCTCRIHEGVRVLG